MTGAPRFIVLEGLDGSGKSTLARMLASALDAELLSTPPASLAGVRPVVDAAYERSPQAAQLFYASTVLHVSAWACRTIGSGRHVVCDRYWLSTIVYDSLRCGAVDLAAVEAALLPADLTVLVEADDEERVRRLEQRGLSTADRQALPHASGLSAAYRRALSSRVAGAALVLDSTHKDPATCARRILDVVGHG